MPVYVDCLLTEPIDRDCVSCELAEVRGGVPCTDMTPREKRKYRMSVYKEFTDNNNIRPLLFWLRKIGEK